MGSNKDYISWLNDIKSRFRSAQAKAMVRVNRDMLDLYWSIGRDLVEMKAEQNWGAGVVKQFSLDMRNAFPGETGFSISNVKNIKRWYLFYSEQLEKGQQVVGFLKMPDVFGLVPWGHHVCIVSKAKSLDEAMFYINKTIEDLYQNSLAN